MCVRGFLFYGDSCNKQSSFSLDAAQAHIRRTFHVAYVAGSEPAVQNCNEAAHHLRTDTIQWLESAGSASGRTYSAKEIRQHRANNTTLCEVNDYAK